MNFNNYLVGNAQKIDQELTVSLATFLADAKKTHPVLVGPITQLINACKGGKRIRGVLMKLGYEISKGSKSDQIIQLSAALEILHTSLLIHDDIIDQSPIRRGQPSLHQLLGGGHQGNSLALVLGDIGLYLPLKLIAEADFSPEIKISVLGMLTQIVIETGWGQLLDIELPNLGKRDNKDILTMMDLKTARYSLSGPLILGAMLAGANPKLTHQLKKYGDNLGLAYQIQDDILGVFGEKNIGKSVTSDIEQGKNTLLISYAISKAGRKDKQILNKFYGKGKTERQNILKIKEIFVKTGALNYAQKQLTNYISLAKKNIPLITKDPKMSKMLEQLAEYLVQRRK